MESLSVERLDHLGILSEVIKDLGLIRLIDARLVPDELEEITPGEAVAGMILNSLGFSVVSLDSVYRGKHSFHAHLVHCGVQHGLPQQWSTMWKGTVSARQG